MAIAPPTRPASIPIRKPPKLILMNDPRERTMIIAPARPLTCGCSHIPTARMINNAPISQPSVTIPIVIASPPIATCGDQISHSPANMVMSPAQNGRVARQKRNRRRQPRRSSSGSPTASSWPCSADTCALLARQLRAEAGDPVRYDRVARLRRAGSEALRPGEPEAQTGERELACRGCPRRLLQVLDHYRVGGLTERTGQLAVAGHLTGILANPHRSECGIAAELGGVDHEVRSVDLLGTSTSVDLYHSAAKSGDAHPNGLAQVIQRRVPDHRNGDRMGRAVGLMVQASELLEAGTCEPRRGNLELGAGYRERDRKGPLVHREPQRKCPD